MSQCIKVLSVLSSNLFGNSSFIATRNQLCRLLLSFHSMDSRWWIADRCTDSVALMHLKHWSGLLLDAHNLPHTKSDASDNCDDEDEDAEHSTRIQPARWRTGIANRIWRRRERASQARDWRRDSFLYIDHREITAHGSLELFRRSS